MKPGVAGEGGTDDGRLRYRSVRYPRLLKRRSRDSKLKARMSEDAGDRHSRSPLSFGVPDQQCSRWLQEHDRLPPHPSSIQMRKSGVMVERSEPL